jgi:hypothetical protein
VRPWVGDVGDCSEESDFSRACFLAERRPCHQASQMRIAITTAPSAAPTPIAALSPVESPLWDVGVLDEFGFDVVDDAVLLVDCSKLERELGKSRGNILQVRSKWKGEARLSLSRELRR